MKKSLLKRFLGLVASSAIMMTSVFGVGVFAATKPSETNYCGDIRYTFYDENSDGKFDTLEISGYGPIPTFRTSGDDAAPWRVQRNNIKKVIIDDGIKSIGANSFYEFNYIEEISIPDSVQDIGKGAFYRCSRLESIELPYGIETIESNTFGCCSSLKSITIPETVIEIGSMAFCYCSELKTVVFDGDELTTIGPAAFSGCNFTEFVVPDGVTTVKENVFNGCRKLKKITFPSSVKTLGAKALANCENLYEVYFDCRIPLDFDENWGFEEKYFKKEHTYVNGTCIRCKRNANEKTIPKNDWEEVATDIDLTANGSTVSIEMNLKDTVVPDNVFLSLEGRRIKFVIKTENGFVWTINGKDITEPKQVNLGVKFVKNIIPTSVVKRYSVDNQFVEIELAGNGDFGFAADLTVDVGTENNGKTAVLYFYNEEVNNNVLELVETAKIEDGKVTFTLTHASNYVIDIYGEGNGTGKEDEFDDGVIIDFAAGENLIVEEIIL